MRADFVLEGERWAAYVGDGLLGPAGSDLLALGGVHLELDRTCHEPLLAVLLDEDADEDLEGERRLLPGRDQVRAGRGTGVEVDVPPELVAVAAQVARLQGEIAAVGVTSVAERAFEAVALLESLPGLAALDEVVPGSADPAAAARRAVRLADDAAVREWILEPRAGEERFEALQALLERARTVVPDLDDLLGWARQRDEAPVRMGGSRLRSAEPPAEAEVNRSVTPSPSLPRAAVSGDTFTVAPSAVLTAPARGTIRTDRDGTWHVRLEGIVRPSATADLGALWVRLFAGSSVVGGGSLRPDDSGRAEAVFAGPGRPGPVTEVEVWLNPYRYPSPTTLAPRSVIQLAGEALDASRDAARRPVDTAGPAWQDAARRWLAAGYFDRAAMAWALAGEDDQAHVWVRSEAAQRRLDAGVPNPRPVCLDWHPDVAGTGGR